MIFCFSLPAFFFTRGFLTTTTTTILPCSMNEVFLSGLRPKADLLRKTPGPYITSNIKLELLPLYQQAALQTGYSLSVIAREGEPYTFLAPRIKGGTIMGVEDLKTITIQPGFVAVSIEK